MSDYNEGIGINKKPDKKNSKQTPKVVPKDVPGYVESHYKKYNEKYPSINETMATSAFEHYKVEELM